MEFVVDRSKWRCGGHQSNPHSHGPGMTYLQNSYGYRCCLGFCALQCGLTEKEIYHVDFPGRLRVSFKDHPRLTAFVNTKMSITKYPNSRLSEKALGINDAGRLTDEKREKQLTELFAEYGHTIRFVGEFA